MNLLGANYKTLLSGIGIALFALLNALALAPTELGDFGMIIPPTWKAKILMVSLAAAFIMRILNAVHQKDKSVTGGSVQQTLGGDVAPVGTQSLVAETSKASPVSEQIKQPESNS
jgi:predicted outer membrane lipoprotein